MSETIDRKKMTNVYILEILKQYTDATPNAQGNPSHTLTQTQIQRLLERDYGITMQRRAISNGLFDLAESSEFHDKIEYDHAPRKAGKNPDPTEARTNFCFVHDFDPVQIRFLTEAVLFSKNIPDFDCKVLLKKISNLVPVESGEREQKQLGKLQRLSHSRVAANPEILNSIDCIEEAIERKRQISFTVNEYDMDFKLHPILAPDGTPLERTVNPYGVIANNGYYYLVFNYDPYGHTQNIRIDKITGTQITDIPRKNKCDILARSSTPKTPLEQLYMADGETTVVVFRIANSKSLIGEMIDWFGKSIVFGDVTDSTVTCTVKTNTKVIELLALQYAEKVEILNPVFLREKIANILLSVCKKYNPDQTEGNTVQVEKSSFDLVGAWETLCRNASENIFDVRQLAELIKDTYYSFLPYAGQSLPYEKEVILKALRTVQNSNRTRCHSHLHLIALVLQALNNKVEQACFGKHKNAEAFDGILRIKEYTGNGKESFEIDMNRFEEDYVTLLQYTDEQAEYAKKAMAELCRRMREHQRQKTEERRAKRMAEQEENRKKEKNT